jgi:hypothetical protein
LTDQIPNGILFRVSSIRPRRGACVQSAAGVRRRLAKAVGPEIRPPQWLEAGRRELSGALHVIASMKVVRVHQRRCHVTVANTLSLFGSGTIAAMPDMAGLLGAEISRVVPKTLAHAGHRRSAHDASSGNVEDTSSGLGGSARPLGLADIAT